MNIHTGYINTREKGRNIMVDYVVKAGDNLTKIARKNHTSVNELVRINNISNPNLIYEGQVIKLFEQPKAKEQGGTGQVSFNDIGDLDAQINALNEQVSDLQKQQISDKHSDFYAGLYCENR